MAQSRQCPKCSGSMTEGFVVDASHGTMGVSSWIEGPPVKSVWTGVALSGKGRTEIATWRCSRCGFLEHYAPAAPDSSHEAKQRHQVLLVVAITLAILLAVVGVVLVLR